MKIADDITALIGGTPLVKLRGISERSGATIVGKLEFFNPVGSVKDRIGVAMIDAAEKRGASSAGRRSSSSRPAATPASRLAFVAAANGYQLVLTMPETHERWSAARLLRAYGAELVLTPGAEGMKGAIAKAEELAAGDRPAPSCRSSSRTRPTPRSTAGPPPRRSGTTPTARWTSSSPASAPAAPSPASARSSSSASRRCGSSPSSRQTRRSSPAAQPGPHKIQGIGAGFVPKVLNTRRRRRSRAGRPTTRPFDMRPRLATEEGILVGISAGANACAAYLVGEPSREQGQAHRDRHVRHRRALPLDRPVRRARAGGDDRRHLIPAPII